MTTPTPARPSGTAYHAADTTPTLAIRPLLMALLAGVAAGVLALLLLRANPGASLLGAAPHGYWYLSRTSALVAFGLLWLATALGLLITDRLARVWPGGPLAFDLHQYASALGLLVALFHAAILLGDRYIGYTPRQLLIPFGGGQHRPLAVALGQVGCYLLIGIWASSRLRLTIGQRWWRRIHFLSFLAFGLALLHGVLAGSDSVVWGVRALYWFSGGSILWLTAYRILGVRRNGSIQGAKPLPAR